VSEDWKENAERVQLALRGARFGYKWIRIPCPFCEDLGHRDRKRSLGVKAADGGWHCFRCQTSGKLEEAPDPRMAEMGVEEKDPDEVTIYDPPESFELLGVEPGLSALTFEDAHKYMKSRGVSKSMMRKLEIGACDDGWYAGRIVVPLITSDHRGWLGFVARLWVPKPSRNAQGRAALPYLYPKDMPRGRFFFNHDATLVESDDPVLITEGVFDALPYYPHASAVWGKPSHMQLDALARSKRPVAMCLDGDAWQESWIAAQRLRFDGVRAGYVKLPPGEDPASLARSRGTEWLMREARACIDRRM